MAQLLTTLEVKLPEVLEDITERSLSQCLRWDFYNKQLNQRFVSRFRNEFYKTYFNLNKISKDVKEEVILSKDLVFQASIKLKEKSISYSEVYNDFNDYLEFILEQYREGILREGVITIDGEPHMVCDDLIRRIDECIIELRKGKTTLEKKLKIIKPILEEAPKSVTISYERNYYVADEHNGNLYVKADSLLGEGDKKIKSFKSLLLQNSLGVAGVSELEDMITIQYPFGNVVYLHKLEPQTSVKYAEIIDSFVGKDSEDPEDESKLGDLHKLRMMTSKEQEERLRNSGLIDNRFIKDYDPKIREGLVRVRLEGVLKRLKLYKERFSKSYIEQNLLLIPA